METVVHKEDQGSTRKTAQSFIAVTRHKKRLDYGNSRHRVFWGIFVFSFILEKSVENLEKG